MTTGTRDTIQLGDLVAAAFDEAETCSTDPQVVSRLVTLMVNEFLRWAPRTAARLRPRATDARQATGDGRATG